MMKPKNTITGLRYKMENIKVTLDDMQVKHLMKHLGINEKCNWIEVKTELQRFAQKILNEKVKKLEGLYYINN